jgi:hypothetical protein
LRERLEAEGPPDWRNALGRRRYERLSSYGSGTANKEGNHFSARALPAVLETTFICGENMSVGTILLIILVIALLGGFSGLGGGPFYGTGYYGGGGIGLVLVIVLILVVLGKL